jgi:transposase
LLRQRPEANEPERVAKDILQMVFEQFLSQAENEALRTALKEAANEDEPEAEPEPKKPKKSRKGCTRPSLKDLPVTEIREVPPEVQACGGVGWKRVDEEVSERLAYQRARFHCLRVIREKWVKLSPEGQWCADQIVTAPLPEWMLPRTMADTSTIASIIVDKYAFMLPWHRQEQMLGLQGFELSRSTMSDWTERAYELASPVVAAMHAESIRESYCIATDATGAPVRISGGRANWHVFVFIADVGHITFLPTRRHSGDAVRQMLDGYEGHLLSDAASIYNALWVLGVVAVACWSHARRYFWKARLTEPDLAYQALALIKGIFDIARKAKRMSVDDRAAYRRTHATPIVKALDAWVDDAKAKAEDGGRIDAALTYYTNQREALGRFLTDGRLEADNNGAERELRALAKGRDNWQHFETANGLKWYCVFRSLISSCKLNGINPYDYLEQMLHLARHWPTEKMLALSPKYWRDTIQQLTPREREIIEPPWYSHLRRAPSRDGPPTTGAI